MWLIYVPLNSFCDAVYLQVSSTHQSMTGDSPVSKNATENEHKTFLFRAPSSCIISTDFLTIISSSGNRLQTTPVLSRFNECRLSIVYLVDLRFFRRSKCKNIHELTLEKVHRSFVTNVVPALIYNSPLFNIKCTIAQLVFLLPLPLFYNHVTHLANDLKNCTSVVSVLLTR